jgi:hypothetical protein
MSRTIWLDGVITSPFSYIVYAIEISNAKSGEGYVFVTDYQLSVVMHYADIFMWKINAMG